MSELHRQLRADILNGKLPPGSKLAAGELQQRYNCSASVLREVLPQLVGEGLAVSEPQLGYWVMRTTAEDLAELTEARIAIETMALERALKLGDVHWEARLVATHHLLDSLHELDDEGAVSQEFLAAHVAFHRALLDGCENARLLGVAASLRDCAEIYRCRAARSDAMFRSGLRDEHRRIFEAALSRDVDTAREELARHIQHSADVCLSSFD